MPKQTESTFIGGFGLGVLVGAGAFMLFATKRGKEWREQLREFTKEVTSEMGQDNVEMVEDAARETFRDFLSSLQGIVQAEVEELVESNQQRKSLEPKQKKSIKKPTFKNTKKP